MPYGGSTPEQDRRIEDCVNKIKGTNKRTGKPYTKSEKIAICKSSIMSCINCGGNMEKEVFSYPISDEDFTKGEALKNVEIFKTGKFRDKEYTTKDLDKIVDNFEELKNPKIGFEPPVRIGHRSEEPRQDALGLRGYVEKLKRVGKKLFADLDITEPDLMEKIKRGTLRKRSVELGPYEDNSGKEYELVLQGLGWVDIPQVEGMLEVNLYNKPLKQEDMTNDTKKPYGDVVYADPGYQKDGKKRYPVDTEKHVRAAWSYINMPKNAKKYTSEQLQRIKGKIKSAAHKFGIEISENNSKENLMAEAKKSKKVKFDKQEVSDNEEKPEEEKVEEKVEPEKKEEEKPEEKTEEKEEEKKEEKPEEPEKKEEEIRGNGVTKDKVEPKDPEEEPKDERDVKLVKLSKEELIKTMDKKDKEIKKLSKELETMQMKNRESLIDAFVKEGKSTPSMKDKEKEFIKALSDEQFSKYAELKKEQPKIIALNAKLGEQESIEPKKVADTLQAKVDEAVKTAERLTKPFKQAAEKEAKRKEAFSFKKTI